MEKTAVFGILIGIGGILLGNAIEGGHTASLIQGAAAMIVLSGTLGAVMLSSKMEDLEKSLELLPRVFSDDIEKRTRQIYSELIDCARVAKKETPLILEQRLPKMSNAFLHDVIRTVVDAVDGKLIRQIFEKRMQIEEEKKMRAARVWLDAGGFAPTIGILGAVLGLIHVMGNLTDTSKLGAGIATAFVATIYGVGFANLIFIPIGNKLKKVIQSEIELMEMILEAGISIQDGQTPGLVEIKLQPYLEKKKK